VERSVRRLRMLGLAAATIGIAACASTPEGTRSATAGLPDLEQSLTATEWLLDASDSSPAVAGGTPVTLAFAGATAASGAAPCNTYRGGVVLDGDDGVRLEDIATTLMSCEPEVMAAERDYLAALEQVRAADVSDPERLVLTSDGVRLSFTAADG
jgi:heat shock protein HslJ